MSDDDEPDADEPAGDAEAASNPELSASLLAAAAAAAGGGAAPNEAAAGNGGGGGPPDGDDGSGGSCTAAADGGGRRQQRRTVEWYKQRLHEQLHPATQLTVLGACYAYMSLKRSHHMRTNAMDCFLRLTGKHAMSQPNLLPTSVYVMRKLIGCGTLLNLATRLPLSDVAELIGCRFNRCNMVHAPGAPPVHNLLCGTAAPSQYSASSHACLMTHLQPYHIAAHLRGRLHRLARRPAPQLAGAPRRCLRQVPRQALRRPRRAAAGVVDQRCMSRHPVRLWHSHAFPLLGNPICRIRLCSLFGSIPAQDPGIFFWRSHWFSGGVHFSPQPVSAALTIAL